MVGIYKLFPLVVVGGGGGVWIYKLFPLVVAGGG